MKFSEIKELNPNIISDLSNRNIVTMTDIQEKAFKHILSGRDLIAASSTGSGKTLAYLIPIIMKLNPDCKNVQSIILVPTQELAAQINEQVSILLNSLNNSFQSNKTKGAIVSDLSVSETGESNITSANKTSIKLCSQFVIGEGNINRQIEALKSKPCILIGTPARILQLIQMKKLKVHEVKTLVLDEADKLCKKTYIEQIYAIRKCLMKRTQVLLFSASIDAHTRKTANDLTFKAIYMDINANKSADSLIPKTIKHIYFLTERRERIEMLRKVIAAAKPEKAMIFINSKYDLEESYQKLMYHNYSVDYISSDKDKIGKKNAINNFKSGKTKYLLCTDIAARGLQIDNVDVVINVTLPEESSEYLHRAGRCGRNGNKGTCISILTENEINKIKKYQKDFKINVVAKKLYQGKIVAK